MDIEEAKKGFDNYYALDSQWGRDAMGFLIAEVERLQAELEKAQIEIAWGSGAFNQVMAMQAEINEVRGKNNELRAELEDLRGVIQRTLENNAHLTDGENCTLKELRDAYRQKWPLVE